MIFQKIINFIWVKEIIEVIDIKIIDNSHIFRKIVVAFTISIVLIILILSTILYRGFESKAVSNMKTFSIDGLRQVSYTSTLMSNLAKSMAMQIYLDKSVSRIFMYSPNDQYDLDFLTALERIKSYSLTNPHIHSIYIYNGAAEEIYSTYRTKISSIKDFPDREILPYIQKFNESYLLYPICRRIRDYNAPSVEKYVNVYSFIYNDLRQGDLLKDSVVVNISENWLQNTVKRLDSDSGSSILIVDQKGNSIMNSTALNMEGNLSGDSYVKKILSSSEATGTFDDYIAKNRVLVTYVKSESLNWYFIRITPYNVFMKGVNVFRMQSITIAIVILILGLVTTFVVSKKLYKPISVIINERDSLKMDGRANEYEKKNSFLSKLICNSSKISEQNIKKNFELYKIKLTQDTPFFVVLYTIDCFSEICQEYSLDDRSLLNFSIMNISSEIFSLHFPNEQIIIDDNSDQCALLLNMETGRYQESLNLIRELAQKSQEAINRYLRLSVTISISDYVTSYKDISESYTYLINVSKNRLIFGRNSVILASDLETKSSMEYSYPYDKEKRLVEALKLQKFQDAKSIYDEMTEEAKECGYNTLNCLYIQLTVSIGILVDSLRICSRILLPFDVNEFINVINHKETMQEIGSEFYNVFLGIVNNIQIRSNNSEQSERNERVIEYIKANYFDQNLSVDVIADILGVSSNYLGRNFRKQYMCSIADYISNVRIEKGKEIMVNTDKTINEIAELCGFSNKKYFCTLFKKANGIAPSIFRLRYIREISENDSSSMKHL